MQLGGRSQRAQTAQNHSEPGNPSQYSPPIKKRGLIKNISRNRQETVPNQLKTAKCQATADRSMNRQKTYSRSKKNYQNLKPIKQPSKNLHPINEPSKTYSRSKQYPKPQADQKTYQKTSIRSTNH